MANYAKGVLTGSTNGRPIAVLGATTSGGTLLHTALAATGNNQADEVWLWAANVATTSGQVVLRFGGVSLSDEMYVSIPPREGYIMICPGLILNGGLEVRAHASASNVVNIAGYINQVTT